MKVEDLGIWNATLSGCGCCPMPKGDKPLLVGKSIEVNLGAYGFNLERIDYSNSEWDNVPYNRDRSLYTTSYYYSYDSVTSADGDSRSSTLAVTNQWFRNMDTMQTTYNSVVNTEENTGNDNVSCPGYESTETVSGGGPGNTSSSWSSAGSGLEGCSGNDLKTLTYSNPSYGGGDLFASLAAEADFFIAKAKADLTWNPYLAVYFNKLNRSAETTAVTQVTWYEGASYIGEDDPSVVGYGNTQALKRRSATYQWQIPRRSLYSEQPPSPYIESPYPQQAPINVGVYCKITWDVLTIGDLSYKGPIPLPDPTLEEMSWEWSGPGSGDQDDPSWASPEYELFPPDFPGIQRIVNTKYTDYRSEKTGTKPNLLLGYDTFDAEDFAEYRAEYRLNRLNTRTGSGGNSGSEGNEGNSGNKSLKIGSLKIGSLKIGSLKIGKLKIGSLKISKIQSSNGLKMSKIQSSNGLKMSKLESSSGLKRSKLESSSGLKMSSGLQKTDYSISSSKGSTLKLSSIKITKIGSSSGLGRSSGLGKRTRL